jgi:hypothetical protein
VRELLMGLLIAGTTAWAVCLLTALWVRHRIRRHLRIEPTVRTSAPTIWIGSPTTASRYHRRLRRAATTARTASTLDPSLSSLADEVVVDALRLEPAVVMLRGTGRTGSAARREVAAQIRELEAVAWRLTRMASSSPSSTTAGSRLRERAALLEAARQELHDIDLHAGVLRHT